LSPTCSIRRLPRLPWTETRSIKRSFESYVCISGDVNVRRNIVAAIPEIVREFDDVSTHTGGNH